MKCRPGDIAAIVRAPIPEFESLLGCMLVCIDVCTAVSIATGEWAWHIEPLSPRLAAMPRVGHFPDSCLRPVRGDPGADETLAWARVPLKPAKAAGGPAMNDMSMPINSDVRIMTDLEREIHIKDCGHQLLRANERGDHAEAHLWLQTMNDAINGRSTEQIRRMEQRYFGAPTWPGGSR